MSHAFAEVPYALPERLRPELEAYIEDVGAGLGGYGRTRSAGDYVAMLLEREPEARLSAALGGSRSRRAEAARKLVARSPWSPAALIEGTLRRVKAQGQPFALAVHATALRAHISDDEPRFNFVVIAAAFSGLSGRREIPLISLLDEAARRLPAPELVEFQLHGLGHLAELTSERRVLSFGADHPESRARLHLHGWRYMQHVFPQLERRGQFELVRPSQPNLRLADFPSRLTGLPLGRSVRFTFEGALALDGQVPSWPETLIGAARWEHDQGAPAVDWLVTNADSGGEDIDFLARLARAQTHLVGHLDLVGAGRFRGPTQLALARHLALVDVAVGFVVERAMHGCEWALGREQVAAYRYMDRFRAERVALGAILSKGERNHVEEVLSGDVPANVIQGPRARAASRREAALAAAREAIAESSEDSLQRARLTHELSTLLSESGRSQDALEAIDEAVRIGRQLTAVGQEGATAELALALEDRRKRLTDLGHYDEAYRCLAEILELLRASEHDLDFAMAANISTTLAHAGDVAAALEAIEIGVRGFRRLQAAYDAAEKKNAKDGRHIRVGLATALNNLSNRLAEAGRKQAGLVAIEEAIPIFQTLATEVPHTYTKDLAGGFTTWSARLAELGRDDEALDVARRAVSLFEELFELHPTVSRPGLVKANVNLAARLSRCRLELEAVAMAERAVDVAVGPGGELRIAQEQFAGCLAALAHHLRAAGRSREAIHAARKRVALFRQPSGSIEAFQLASALVDLARDLLKDEQHREAVTTAAQGLELLDALGQEGHVHVDPVRGRALWALSDGLADLGRCDASISAARDATAVMQQVAERRPEATDALVNAGASLNNLAVRLVAAGEGSAAAAAAGQAVATYRAVRDAGHHEAEWRLAGALEVTARSVATSSFADALRAQEEAAAIRREAYTTGDARWLWPLGTCLDDLAALYAEVGAAPDAVATSAEAVARFRKLAAANPSASTALAKALHNMSGHAVNVQRYDDAVRCTVEAMNIIVPVLEETPEILPDAGFGFVNWYINLLTSRGVDPDPALVRRMRIVLLQAGVISDVS